VLGNPESIDWGSLRETMKFKLLITVSTGECPIKIMR